jgi:hypothetical protein
MKSPPSALWGPWSLRMFEVYRAHKEKAVER